MESDIPTVSEVVEESGLDEWVEIYPNRVTFVYPENVDRTVELYQRSPIVRDIIDTELDDVGIHDHLTMKGHFHERRGDRYAVTKGRLGVFNE